MNWRTLATQAGTTRDRERGQRLVQLAYQACFETLCATGSPGDNYTWRTARDMVNWLANHECVKQLRQN